LNPSIKETTIQYSIIIPVYNRPQELLELLDSLVKQNFKGDFDVVVVEDGSTITSSAIIKQFSDRLAIHYFVKDNSGPGLTRNFGMQRATGEYFIILDSDCILPMTYLTAVDVALKNNFTDAFGGADAAHDSFTTVQKAINYSMTSVLTTGGIRGHKNLRHQFQLRSFNMGISKAAFLKTTGFGKQRFGEDIDLTFRLWQHNFETQFIEKAFVYHKRRTNWKSFFRQTFNFGAARPILNMQHPNSSKITYWLPSLFVLGLLFSTVALVVGYRLFLAFYLIYFILIFIDSLLKNKNGGVGALSIFSTFIQFSGYGLGFLRSFFRVRILQKPMKESFPRMFG
jgi:glycosyltransferase involved in cell wall biosynthesis